MRLKQMQFKFLYKVGEINVQQDYIIEVEDNERVDWLSWVEGKAREFEQAGFTSPVSPGQKIASPIAKQHGANGRNPLVEKEPVIGADGKQQLCPRCSRGLYWVEGIAKKGPRAGQAYRAKMHYDHVKDCDFVDWGR